MIGDYLENIQRIFDIEIGSYPYFKKNQFGVSLVITGDSLERVENAVKKINAYLESKNGEPRLF